jgi:uncharacterized SAM-binding protein YcdF (DUF218 family)
LVAWLVGWLFGWLFVCLILLLLAGLFVSMFVCSFVPLSLCVCLFLRGRVLAPGRRSPAAPLASAAPGAAQAAASSTL